MRTLLEKKMFPRDAPGSSSAAPGNPGISPGRAEDRPGDSMSHIGTSDLGSTPLLRPEDSALFAAFCQRVLSLLPEDPQNVKQVVGVRLVVCTAPRVLVSSATPFAVDVRPRTRIQDVHLFFTARLPPPLFKPRDFNIGTRFFVQPRKFCFQPSCVA